MKGEAWMNHCRAIGLMNPFAVSIALDQREG
jgi:hypothetical protein